AQALDHRQHLRDMVRRAGLEVGPLDAQGGLVLVHGGDEAVGERADGLVVLDRPPDDLVVDVGDVAHVAQLVAARPQPALDHVEDDQHPGMTDVAVVVDRHAAHVHAHATGLDRLEYFLATGFGIVDSQHRGNRGWPGQRRIVREFREAPSRPGPRLAAAGSLSVSGYGLAGAPRRGT